MTRFRRYLTLPIVVAFEVLLLLAGPLLMLVAAVVAACVRSSRPVRTVLLALGYAAVEIRTLARIAGTDVDWDALVTELVGTAYSMLRTILDVRLVLTETSPRELPGNPVVVLARHCGPGDSLFIAWLITVFYRLRPHIVLKAVLRVEPLLDLAGDHVPLCFVRRHQRGRAAIGTVAGGMTAGDALLLFPEGGNFSWQRWHDAVSALDRAGLRRAARRVRAHTHTLPPHHGGALAALAAAPTADVLLLAHTGFTRDGRDRPWWRLPTHRPFVVRTTLVPAADVPRTEADLPGWLDARWAEVDAWVAEVTATP